MELVYRHERSLFAIAVTTATILWLLIIVGTLGIALLFLLLGFVLYLFAQSGFIAHIKGNGVRVSESQYHDLHERLKACCARIGMPAVPEMYLLRTDTFNALATKFLGRRFIVLFTDVADALADEPDALNFYIGHELGHLHRGHLKWMGYLLPAMFLPVLGTAYRRAQEYSCDRYGAFCCAQERQAQLALAVISAGDSRYRNLSWRSFVEQVQQTSGFWMSFHEFTSDYPWLCKRMASTVAFMRKEEIRHPRRSVFAGLLSLFVPRAGFGAGGAASLIIMIAMIAILASIAIPAYEDYTTRAQLAVALEELAPLKAEVESFAAETGDWPLSLLDLGYATEDIQTSDQWASVSLYEGGVIGVMFGVDAAGQGEYAVLEPISEGDAIVWLCYGQNVAETRMPSSCRD